MEQELSRRGVLTGLGAAAAGAAGLGIVGFSPSAGAAAAGGDGGFGAPEAGSAVGPRAAVTLTPGLTYVNYDPICFTPFNFAQGRVINGSAGSAAITTGTGGLFAPIVVPVGSTIKEVTLSYESPAGAAAFVLFKRPVGNSYTAVNNPPGGTALANGAGVLASSLTVNEVVDATTTYMVMMNNISTAQSVVNALVGYVPPAQAFVPLAAVTRVLDTRTTGGKLNPNEERVVNLGVPGFAKAAVINITVTDTEGAGFVAVFPANVPYPGNSTINWSAPGQILANGAITAVDPGGNAKIRGGVNRTHIVIDVQGYLL